MFTRSFLSTERGNTPESFTRDRSREGESPRGRGSSNQRIHFLTRRYAREELALDDEGVWLETRIDSDAAIRYLGIPPQGFVEHVAERLHSRGIEVLERC